jgi:mRNA interferase YafQ
VRIISPTSRFDRDLKNSIKRKKDISKLEVVVKLLSKDGKLSSKYRPHPLIGEWLPSWECHIEPDWLLIYQVSKTHVYLFRIGSHSDLFN